MKKFIGIDFGGTNIKLGLFDKDLNLIVKDSIPTYADKGPEVCIEAIVQACEKILSENSIDKIDIGYMGIGLPGPVNLKEGILVSPPNLPLFHGCPIRDMLAEAMGVPVVMENDANAAGWAEHVCGVAEDADDMAFLTLGTGIGGAVITGGKLAHGSTDACGELGHIIIYPDGRKCGCGQLGCAETYASASSTARRANELLAEGIESSLQAIYKEKGEVTCKDIYLHAADGDDLSVNITEGTAKVLGLLCVNIMNFMDPKKIVFAGGMIAAGEQLLSRIKYYFAKYAWPGREKNIEIMFASLGEDAGIIGNASLAILEYKAKN
ncbi:MAG: ROK family protein [Sedimentisphaeraceae bacterium JB056]